MTTFEQQKSKNKHMNEWRDKKFGGYMHDAKGTKMGLRPHTTLQ